MPNLKSALPRLRALLLTQRTTRLLLRAAWTGFAGYLIAWGINDLYGSLPGFLPGILPDSRTWFAFGFLLAFPSLLALLRPLPMSHLAWNLDRRFELREQLSTAWQTAQRPEQTRVSTLLLSDVETLLPPQRARILRRGWFLARDLMAMLVVAVLLFTINAFAQANIPYALAPQRPSLDLPPLAESPTYDDLFPSGIPGLTDPPANDPGQTESLTPDQASTLDDLLSELGETLSENPETAPAGEALQQGNLAEAASEIERLADELDSLPEEARQNAQDAFQRAAEQAEQAGQEDLAEAFQQAADGMKAPDSNNLEAAEALDDLAGEFRQLENQFASIGQAGDQDPATAPSANDQPGDNEGGAAAGTGTGGEGQPEPLERLEGEGQTAEIQGDDTPSGLLTPGEATGDPTPGGGPIIASGEEQGDTTLIESILTPYTFLWRWRDVVSKYFSPPQ